MPDSAQLAAQSHIDLENRIRARAHEIWLSRRNTGGRGTALEDWLEAEREVLGEQGRDTAQDRATVVGDAHAPDRSRIEGLGKE